MREKQRLCRINTCGNPSGGNGTLIARLLSECKPWEDAELAELARQSKELGTRPGELDFARLLWGTTAATDAATARVGVEHRFLATQHRRLIVADVQGDEPSTRSVLAAASSADCSLLVLDASLGISKQARRHAFLVALLGVPRIVVAVDRMERVGFSEICFSDIEREFCAFGARTKLPSVSCIPVSSLAAENVRERSSKMPWYSGETLVGVLDGLEPIEVVRGDLLVAADRPADTADQFEVTLAWLGKAPLLPGRTYVMKIGASTVNATVTPLKYKIDLETLQRIAAATLELDDVGVCNLGLDRRVAFDAYSAHSRDTGGFVLLDASGAPVAAGMLHFALRRAKNVHWQAIDVNKTARATLKGQKPCVLWYTGLSGAGKSSIANLVDKKLHAMNRHTYLLDGDNVRQGLNKDLGFTDADRVENIRRIAEVAKLMVDAGLIVGTAFISPFRAERRMARALLLPDEFLEIFVDTPLAVAEERDPKGLYAKARRGELSNFTGIDSPYEVPENPELRIDTQVTSPDEAAEVVIRLLRARGCLRE